MELKEKRRYVVKEYPDGWPTTVGYYLEDGTYVNYEPIEDLEFDDEEYDEEAEQKEAEEWTKDYVAGKVKNEKTFFFTHEDGTITSDTVLGYFKESYEEIKQRELMESINKPI